MAIKIREEWKEIEGLKNRHWISNFGRVKNIKGLRKIQDDKDGYQTLMIERKHYKVHRLVGLYFIPNNDPEARTQINHIDGCKWNNHIDNLEWATPSENRQHAYDTGLQKPVSGSKHGRSKLTEQIVLAIRKILDDSRMTQVEVATLFGVAPNTVSYIQNRITWRHI